MKALTIIQPWATLAAICAKHIETRSWPTNYRGPLAIHAAKGFPAWAQHMLFDDVFGAAFEAAFEKAGIGKNIGGGIFAYEPLPLGRIIATCDLVEVSGPISLTTAWYGCREHWKNKHCFSLTEQERAFGDYSEGRYMWLLENVKLLPEPIPARGAQGLWDWSEA
jgi:hypothetical protein